MELTTPKKMILVMLIIAGFVFGRLIVRFVMNLLLEGTLFGGNFL